MIKFEDLKWEESSYIIAFIGLLALGIVLTFLKEYPLAFFFVTLGFAILSVGLAFKAIDIAKKSKEIALDSDEKMKVITKDVFLAIGRIIGDRRLELQKKFNQLEIMEKNESYKNTLIYKLYKQDFKDSLSYSIWVVYTDLQRVELFKGYLQKDGDLENYQKRILDLIYQYLRFLIIGRDYLKITMLPEHKEHIQKIFDIVKDFSNYSIIEDKTHLKKKYEETRGLTDLVKELVEK